VNTKPDGTPPTDGGPCAECLRRGWLLAQLSGPLDRLARDRHRLLAALALADEDLLRAVGGRRKAELTRDHGSYRGPQSPVGEGIDCVCRHSASFPRQLRAAGGPALLFAAGGRDRLAQTTGGAVVAVVGSRAPSDYGAQSARSVARGLAASGVTVAARALDGVCAAALEGALEVGGAPLAVLDGGLDVACPSRQRRLLGRVLERGCAVSELPPDCRGRHWGALAGERMLAWWADVTVVVEATQAQAELAPAGLARAQGRMVAAIPGRVTSPLSTGTNALLADGAHLVRDAHDVLELLCAADEPRGSPPGTEADRVSPDRVSLDPRLREVLDLVGAGRETPDSLLAAGLKARDALCALCELELLGLLARGAGGRYTPTRPARSHADQRMRS
jgi:DNA processing protein